jgi:hypothetical protein
MASGDDSVERSSTPSDLPVNEAAPQPPKAKADAVNTALWAVVVTLLSNAANILKQLRDVIESATQLQQFVLDHVVVSSIVLGVVVVWGNILLFRFLYHRLRHRVATAYKVLAAAGCVALVTLILVSNLYSLRTLLRGPTEVQLALASQLATAQDAYEGGFRNSVTSAGFQESWTTGQALVAEILAGKLSPERIKHAFSYLESHRKPDGFESIYDPHDNVRFIRAEAADWAAVAYLQSLSHSGLWSATERPAAVTQTENILLMIVSQQDHTSGGWSPVPNISGPRYARTYATMMAIWALAEAMLSPDILPSTKEKIGPAFEAGVAWLITHYQSNQGWEESPRFLLAKPFPGLTYQVLYVLQRAQLVSNYNAFSNTEAYKRIKAEFRQTIHTAQTTELTPVPTEYIMVGQYPCPVDVLSFPWLISVLPLLIDDPDVSSSDRRYLRGVLNDELSKVPDLPHELLHAETWNVAEDLIGLSNFINARRRPK